MIAERRRLALALLLSLLIHTLLLSLTLGGQGLGLPGFGFPWQERRIEAPDLHIVLVPAQVKAVEPAATSVKTPLQQASTGRPVAGGPALTPSLSPAPTLGRTAVAIDPRPKPTARAKTTVEAKPAPDAAAGADLAKAPLRTEGPGDAAPTAIPEPAVIAMERPDEVTVVVPADLGVPTPVIAAAPGASTPETVMLAPGDAGDATQERIDPEARQRALELAELARSEREAQRQAVQLEAARQEAAQQEAALQEAERVQTARLEAERLDAARQAAIRQEAARQEAARQEAERVENARLEAERQEAARQETARQEADRVANARLEVERQEAVRQAAARQEAARIEAAQQAAARREAALRAIGRQLDEEAARREATSTAAGLPSTLAPSSSGARRGRLFGRTDPNVELILYAEAWARKIQLNMTFDMVREAAKRPHTDPLVTVAIRSDGSVDSVTFTLSSGVAEIDEAIRRIVHSQVPYQTFSPGLAREFDVIEIRRTWHFDMAIRLY
ncbi:MAG: hypothetical protein IH627_16990 [Rubrivivax sp.]|nr:hypothetical protein [Rubrivivax sp.]